MEINSETLAAAEARLIAGTMTDAERARLVQSGLTNKVETMLRRIVKCANEKRPGLIFQAPGAAPSGLNRIANRYGRIPIVLAGGRARSPWYRSVIAGANLRQWTVDEQLPALIARPPGWWGDEYPRFAIANGLGDRDGMAKDDARLPDDIPAVPPPPEKGPSIESPHSKEFV
jgi:hypothetical protein